MLYLYPLHTHTVFKNLFLILAVNMISAFITSNVEVGCDPMIHMAVEGEVSGDRRGGTPE